MLLGVLHARVAHGAGLQTGIDISGNAGTAPSGSISVPPARYAGVYYKFNDAGTSANITITHRGQTLYSKVGATNADAEAPYDQTKQPLPVSGTVLVQVDTISGGSPQTLDVTLLFDFGGAG